MKTALTNFVAVIPSIVAQLLAVGGVLALIGAVLFALTFVCQHRQARVATRVASETRAVTTVSQRIGDVVRGETQHASELRVPWRELLPLGVAHAA